MQFTIRIKKAPVSTDKSKHKIDVLFVSRCTFKNHFCAFLVRFWHVFDAFLAVFLPFCVFQMVP